MESLLSARFLIRFHTLYITMCIEVGSAAENVRQQGWLKRAIRNLKAGDVAAIGRGWREVRSETLGTAASPPTNR